MISIDKLKAVKTIITHDNCSDGLMSAILLKDAYAVLGLTPEIRFVQYGTEAFKALKPEPNTLFCDFSPGVPMVDDGQGGKKLDPDALQAWVDAGTLMLDHHKGAKDIVLAMGENGVFADENDQPGVSGAVLAFSEVWEPIFEAGSHLRNLGAAKRFSTLVGVRDTWQKEDAARFQEARALHEVLMFYPAADWLSKDHIFTSNYRLGREGSDSDDFWNDRLKLGEQLLERHDRGIQKAINRAWRFTSQKGTRVVVFEGVKSSSDAAEVLDKEADLVVGFDYLVEPENGKPVRKLILSTRSHSDFNCMNFCKMFGGGGHTRAAGFSVAFEEPITRLQRSVQTQDPYSYVKIVVNEYELGSTQLLNDC